MSNLEYWDVFISHATEDKEEIARPLAKALQDAGLRVWFDEFSLKLSDSISESINFGLAHSVYGIVILSEYYITKDWTKRELAGLFAKEQNEKIILPIWHKISLERIKSYSPILADRLAINSNIGISKLVQVILEVVRPGLYRNSTRDRVTGVLYETPAIIERQPVGIWQGRSGYLRLFESSDEKYQIEGDYDWNGYKWAGHIVGNYFKGVLTFYWWWDKSPERGSGYFKMNPITHTLVGGWSDWETGAFPIDNNNEVLPNLFREWVFDKVETFSENAPIWKG